MGKDLIVSIYDRASSNLVILYSVFELCFKPKACTSLENKSVTSITTPAESLLKDLISKDAKIGDKFEFFTDSYISVPSAAMLV